MNLFVWLLTIGLLFTTINAEGEDLDSLIDSVFTKEPPKSDSMKCGENSECVPYYLCENGQINTDGSGLLDIRFGEEKPCLDYFEQCCAINDILPPETKPTPPPPLTDGGNEQTDTVHRPCGWRNVEGIGFRITGNNDHESEYGEFPWMMAILKEERAAEQSLNVYQCGGSLIHPSVVLTAAHCVSGKTPQSLKVRGGEWDTQTKNELYEHSDRDVVDIVIHKDYYKGGLHNDVALLFLDSPMPIGEHINVVCMPPQDFNFDRANCVVSGWGKDLFGKQGKYQVILKKIDLPVVPNPQCQASLRTTRLGKRFNLHNSFICAGGVAGKDACKGDGGSPLICPVPGQNNAYYQGGIVAWGIGCGEENIPGVYVNVAKFRNWIDQQMTKHGLDPSVYVI
jgi:hypothetical protein